MTDSAQSPFPTDSEWMDCYTIKSESLTAELIIKFSNSFRVKGVVLLPRLDKDST